MKFRSARVGWKPLRVQAAAGDMKLGPRPVDIGHRLEPGYDIGDERADTLVAFKIGPVDRTAVSQHSAAQCGKHRHFAARPAMARAPAVTETHVAEHRLLRRR